MSTQNAIQNESEPSGYGGWLKFLAVTLIFVRPPLVILDVIVIALGSSEESRLYAFMNVHDFPMEKIRFEVLLLAGVCILCEICTTIFGINAALQLRAVRAGAVRKTRQFLVAVLGYRFSFLLLLFLLDILKIPFDKGALDSFGRLFLTTFPGTLLSFLIWYSYLRVSQRVKTTFPNG